jgi:extradiol dioxygenase family protein
MQQDHYPRFHLAFPVTDLEAARKFYGELLGCATGRESTHWIDFDFFGHQLVAHLVTASSSVATNSVDGDEVPAMHFGPVLAWDAWHALVERLRAAGVAWVIEPRVRFAGRRGEQATLFICDPSGNHLEFKAFRDESLLFAKDLEACT